MTPSNIALLPLFSLSRWQAEINWVKHARLLTCNVCVVRLVFQHPPNTNLPNTVSGGVSLDQAKAKKRLRSTYSWGIWISNGYSLTFNLQANHKHNTPRIFIFQHRLFGGMSAACPSISFPFPPTRASGTKTSFTEQSRHLRHNLVGSAVWDLGGLGQNHFSHFWLVVEPTNLTGQYNSIFVSWFTFSFLFYWDFYGFIRGLLVLVLG